MQLTFDGGLVGTSHFQVPAGLSISEIAKHVFGMAKPIAYIRCPQHAAQQWEVVPEAMWKRIKPKVNDCIKFALPQAGGDDIFAIVAVVAVAIAAPYLGTALAAGITGTTLAAAQGTTLALGLQAAVSIGGSLLVQSFFSPASASYGQAADAEAEQRIADVDTDSNLLARGSRPPRVLGIRRVTPIEACEPHRFLEAGREVITRCFVFGGHHEISDIRVKDVAIENIPDAEFEVKDGAEASGQQSIVTKITKNIQIGEQLSSFNTRAESDQLTDQTTPANSEPKAIVIAPGYHPKMEQITLRTNIAPFNLLDAIDGSVRLPVRVALLPKASPETPFNIAEIHIIGRKTIPVPKEIRFRWDSLFGTATASKDYRYDFWREVPASSETLSDGNSGAQWTADAYFGTGGNKNVVNVFATGDSINIQLDESVFPKQEFDVSIVAGLPVRDSDFNSTTYALDGTVHSLFLSYSDNGAWKIPENQDGVSAGLALQFSTMIVDERPVQIPGVAQIGIKTRDISLKSVTCKAGAVIKDWNGSAWAVETTSENPGAHCYNMLKESVNFFDIAATRVTSEAFVDWRQECIDQNRKMGLVASGQSVSDLIDHCMTAGFATRTIDTGYSVDWFRDRSAETADMTFSPRDSKISVQRDFRETPSAVMARFKNSENEWSDDELLVNNPFGATPFPGNEIMEYPSINDPVLVRQRALFDLAQIKYRPRRWQVSTGPAGFNLQKGNLVNLVTDLDSDMVHGFYIREVVSATELRLDREIPEEETEFLNFKDDLSLEPDFSVIGANTVAHVLTPDGVDEYAITSFEDGVLTLAEELPESWTVNSKTYSRSDLKGARLTLASRPDLFRRCIVWGVARQSQQRAVVTLVDEAPEMYEALRKLAA